MYCISSRNYYQEGALQIIEQIHHTAIDCGIQHINILYRVSVGRFVNLFGPHNSLPADSCGVKQETDLVMLSMQYL